MRSRKGWINYAVLVVVLLALILMVDVRSIALAVISTPPALLAAALAIATFDRFVMGYKWRHLILAAGWKVSLGCTISAYYQSGISSRLLPIPVASDLLRAHVVSQAGLPLELIFSSITLEKLMAWLASTLFAVVGIIYFLLTAKEETLGLLGLAFAASMIVGGGGVVLLLTRSAHQFGGKLVHRFLPAKLYRLLQKFSDSILAYRNRPRALLVNLLLALGEQCIQIVKFYVLGRALNIDLPIFALLATIVLMLTVRRMLNYFESWGLAETGTVVLLTLLGISETAAVAMIFLNFVVTTVASLPGIYLMYRNGLNLQEWMRGREKPASPNV